MDMPQGDGGASENRRRGPGRRSSSGHGAEAGADGGGGAAQAPASAPCGACKFLRRKCVSGCIFAPHFGSDQGAARFAAVHKVFGASNVSKLLTHIPVNRRQDAVVTISYEAQARLSDPVYGCVSTIIALQQQVASLQAELSVVQTQLINSRFVLANTLHHQNSPHQQNQNQHQTQHHIINSNNDNNIGAAYSNTSSASNCNNLISNLHHNNNNSTFSTNFAETAPSNNSFEPVNLHLSGRALQDEDEEEDESHDPAVAFANHIFR